MSPTLVKKLLAHSLAAELMDTLLTSHSFAAGLMVTLDHSFAAGSTVTTLLT